MRHPATGKQPFYGGRIWTGVCLAGFACAPCLTPCTTATQFCETRRTAVPIRAQEFRHEKDRPRSTPFKADHLAAFFCPQRHAPYTDRVQAPCADTVAALCREVRAKPSPRPLQPNTIPMRILASSAHQSRAYWVANDVQRDSLNILIPAQGPVMKTLLPDMLSSGPSTVQTYAAA